MQAMWVSWKENVDCRSKQAVVGRRQKCSKERTCTSGKGNSQVELQQTGNPVHKVIFRPNFPRKNEVELPQARNSVSEVIFRTNNPRTKEVEIQQTGIPVCEVLFRPNYPRTQFQKINIGDPSRNIIETIFQKALRDPLKPSRKIKRVLKVKNSVEILERFEKFREKVKTKTNEQCKRHPRNLVDGNELLRFYGTVMTCSERSTQVYELCKDPFCRVCRTIQSNFDTQHLMKNGIRLSTSSEELCDNMAALTKVKNVKRAAIVCRTIAGKVSNLVDGVYEECDSFTSEGLHSITGDLIVKNPTAVLPCFVVVFT